MGRPLGALRGRTEQANELAVWLRKVTLGKAIRTLEQDFAYSTTSWSEFRSGSRLPSEDLLKAVVERYVAEPQMRDRQEAEGLRLLAAAKKAEAALGDTEPPTPAPLPVPVVRGTDEVTKALLRLDDARMRQIEALEKLASSERRRVQLENMVSVLQERCTVLEVERDRAREDVRAELESELQISREYRRQADEKLEHARRAEEKAYQLRLAAEQQVARERLAVNRMDEQTTDDTPEPSSAGPDDLGLPPLEQIRDVLQAAQEQLDVQDDELDDLEDLIGLDHSPEDAVRTAPGQAEGYKDPEPLAAPEEQRSVFSGHPETRWKEPMPVVPEQSEEAQAQGSRVLPDQPQNNPKYLMTERPVLASPDAPSPVPEGSELPQMQHPLDLSPPDDEGDRKLVRLPQLIETAATPEELGVALREVWLRAGGLATWPRTRITALFEDVQDPEWAYRAQKRWFAGVEVPADWNHLERLLTNLGATAPEISAFATAHRKIRSVYPPLLRTPAPRHSPEAVAARRRTRAASQLLLRPPLRVRDVAVPAFAIVFTALAATSWFAALNADPGPSLSRMTWYGLAGALATALVVLVALGIAIDQKDGHGREWLENAAFVGPPLAFGLGSVAPFVGLGMAGQWGADLIALM
ncbi:hypothetical protein ABZY57_28835 [Streptomyces sp. NPDC006450]|uniref:hypothetical protein n=1 Tax=Streptomyces sp. NPDC006450 TaxID=3155458 RepID=UPI0033AFB7B5